MKVYVLLWLWWEDNEVLGVYSTREKAEEHERNFNGDENNAGFVEIFERELDKDPEC